MTIKARTIAEYVKQIPEDRQQVFEKLLSILRENLPPGFEECLSYGMPAFSVPHSLYPKGYHVSPKVALPFISIASQKNFIAFYHMGLYATPELNSWWQEEYPKYSKRKLDMGKSCVRFKKMDDIPFELIQELAQKVSPEEWIATYEKQLKK
ncbi:DUF1801 domain-containing protein [Schleiferiaceae bacterium]|jgi:uncharacterized protein YdhG (YjbR/CyaY superfamily)|nr:DUF1801 domain-containing protein [Bacteroidota bacterium]MDA8565465.1 DUF1801 domain-containing protein [Schleiferiaceae bacterium]MDA8661474.1 DUF1801 domain-containing protein [Schleiferiaceae bacterium]MDA8769426.1 DUF1801 domain-containing protein [Schleiferiaceae bacterium]MDA9191888.1 DUF1801 domain-containing protein [Schleiferiaceae bacterium]